MQTKINGAKGMEASNALLLSRAPVASTGMGLINFIQVNQHWQTSDVKCGILIVTTSTTDETQADQVLTLLTVHQAPREF